MILKAIFKCNYFKRNLCLSTSLFQSAYDSDGKTTVTFLNRQPGMGILIDTFSQVGFTLNNGLHVIGPVVIFPKTVLSWNVEGDNQISTQSLCLPLLLEPKLDVLIIGYGGITIDRSKLDRVVMEIRRERKYMNIEVLPTERAVSTFNFVAAEGRFVAAALVPPLKVSFLDDELIKNRLAQRKLSGDE